MRYGLIAVLLLLTACASPEPHYYTLEPVDGAVTATAPLTIEIHRPAMPAYLNRPEMVEKSGYRITRDNGTYWAEPLDSLIARTLALDVAQRLPGSTVFSESASAAMDANLVIDIDIPQFEPERNGHSMLYAQVAITDQLHHAQTPLPPIILQGEPAATGAPMAKIISALVGQLADHIASGIPTVAEKGALNP